MFGRILMLSLWGAMAVQAEPLTFDSALNLAVSTAPDVSAQAANIAAAQSASIAAGRLPDPKLVAGIDNLPATGVDQWSLTRDFMTMRKIGVLQDVPNHGKRQADSDLATAVVTKAQVEYRARVLSVRRDAAVAWLNRFHLERRAALFDELERENRLFADTVQAQLVSGRGMTADALAPQQEAAELADRRDQLMADIAKSKAALKRWVGLAADEPLAGIPPTLTVDAEHLRAHVHAHPELATFAPMMQMAQAEVHAAEAAKRPDWSVELSYGRRGASFSDMVSVQFTLGLPVFAGSRQNPQIAAKRQELHRIEDERATMLRDHTQALEADLIDYDATTRQLTRVQNTRLPLAQQKVDYQFASYRAGKGELTAVLNARRELIDLELRQIELEGQQATLAAKLSFIYGEGAQ